MENSLLFPALPSLSPLAVRERFGSMFLTRTPSHLGVSNIIIVSIFNTKLTVTGCCCECGAPCQQQETSRWGWKASSGKEPRFFNTQVACLLCACLYMGICVCDSGYSEPNTSTMPGATWPVINTSKWQRARREKMNQLLLKCRELSASLVKLPSVFLCSVCSHSGRSWKGGSVSPSLPFVFPPGVKNGFCCPSLPHLQVDKWGKCTDRPEGLPPLVHSNNLLILKLKYPQDKVPIIV